jgi:hypothetical protein
VDTDLYWRGIRTMLAAWEHYARRAAAVFPHGPERAFYNNRIRGSLRTNAANTARSAQSRRGFGLARRSTATSCRNTRSSTSLDADERPSSNSRFSSLRKIK